MAKYTGGVCRLCRRNGMKLFLKGERCYTDKCAFERRAYAPGQHGQGMMRKPTEYGMQLREKQKMKSVYGLLERQFRRSFFQAEKMKGITGENLLNIMERRMDNMVYRMGFARSREEARHLVRHGHFTVNEKKVSVPSYLLKQGDVVAVRGKSRNSPWCKESLESTERRSVPEWLKLEKEKFRATVVAYPMRDQLTMPINERLVVELYSK